MKINKFYLLIVSLLFVPVFVFADFSRDLRQGLSGDDVEVLQNFLIEKGFLDVSSTGYFGVKTKKATQSFQKSTGLPATGYVGVLTKAKISSLLSTSSTAVKNPPVIVNQSAGYFQGSEYGKDYSPVNDLKIQQTASYGNGNLVTKNTKSVLVGNYVTRISSDSKDLTGINLLVSGRNIEIGLQNLRVVINGKQFGQAILRPVIGKSSVMGNLSLLQNNSYIVEIYADIPDLQEESQLRVDAEFLYQNYIGTKSVGSTFVTGPVFTVKSSLPTGVRSPVKEFQLQLSGGKNFYGVDYILKSNIGSLTIKSMQLECRDCNQFLESIVLNGNTSVKPAGGTFTIDNLNLTPDNNMWVSLSFRAIYKPDANEKTTTNKTGYFSEYPETVVANISNIESLKIIGVTYEYVDSEGKVINGAKNF